MTDKEFRRLSRRQLIDIIFELQKQEQECRTQLEQAEQALQDRQIKLANAGSIAEAALSLNDVFAKAQAAADQYVQEVTLAHENIHGERDRIIAEASADAERILASAKHKAAYILTEAKKRAGEIMTKAKTEREAMLHWTDTQA